MEIVGIFGSKLLKEQLQRMLMVLAGVSVIYALFQAWNSGYYPSIWSSLHSAEIGHDSIAPQSSYDAHISPSIAPQGLVQENGSDASEDANYLNHQGEVQGYRTNDSMPDHAFSPHGVVQSDVKRNISLGSDYSSDSSKDTNDLSSQGKVQGYRRNSSMLDQALYPEGGVQSDVERNISLGLLDYISDTSKDTNDLSSQGNVQGYRRNSSMLDHALSPTGGVQGDVKSKISLGLDVVSSNARGPFNVSNGDVLSNNFSVANQNNVNASLENSVREEFYNLTEDTNSFSGLNAVNGSSQKGYDRAEHDQGQDWVAVLEQQLTFAKNEIENSPAVIVNDPDLYRPLYHNLSRFKRSYEIMENLFKVYVYRDGEKPFFHKGPVKSIYASEGWFMKQMEENKQYVTKDFRKAHMYYIPYSVYEMRIGVPAPRGQNMPEITILIKDQIDMLASKYPFWNRTHGRDHFFVACHDWGPYTTAGHNELKLNAIKVLCNADLSDGYFHLGKDGSLPETSLHGLEQPPDGLGGLSATKRPILAFFAGKNHGRVRPVLFKYWEGKDPDIRVYQGLPSAIAKKKSYVRHMKESKFCICPMGYEVNSPRIVEAIYYDCVPVIIADNFFLPFSEVLKWQSFSVIVAEKDIPKLKDILLGISEKRYLTMYFRLGKVRKHFLWHKDSPKRYDIFHMILHSVWTSRLNQTPMLA